MLRNHRERTLKPGCEDVGCRPYENVCHGHQTVAGIWPCPQRLPWQTSSPTILLEIKALVNPDMLIELESEAILDE